MNYSRIYSQFIESRRGVVNKGERHHIVPRCYGGDNSAENLIVLTPEDHFHAHLLLACIYGGKMRYAAYLMLGRVGNVRGRVARIRYGWVVRAFAQECASAQSERMKCPRRRAQISAALKGRPKSPSSIQQRSRTRAVKGVKFSTETLAASAARLREHRRNNPDKYQLMADRRRGQEVPPAIRQQISESLKGHTVSAKTREKLAAAQRGKKNSAASNQKRSELLRGRKLTPEQCAAMSARQKGRPGKPLSAEAKAKLSVANKGKTLSEEHRAKIGAANRGRGHPQSMEVRAKIAATLSARKRAS